MAGGGRRLCLTLPEVGLSTPTVADVTIPTVGFRQIADFRFKRHMQ